MSIWGVFVATQSRRPTEHTDFFSISSQDILCWKSWVLIEGGLYLKPIICMQKSWNQQWKNFDELMARLPPDRSDAPESNAIHRKIFLPAICGPTSTMVVRGPICLYNHAW